MKKPITINYVGFVCFSCYFSLGNIDLHNVSKLRHWSVCVKSIDMLQTVRIVGEETMKFIEMGWLQHKQICGQLSRITQKSEKQIEKNWSSGVVARARQPKGTNQCNCCLLNTQCKLYSNYDLLSCWISSRIFSSSFQVITTECIPMHSNANAQDIRRAERESEKKLKRTDAAHSEKANGVDLFYARKHFFHSTTTVNRLGQCVHMASRPMPAEPPTAHRSTSQPICFLFLHGRVAPFAPTLQVRTTQTHTYTSRRALVMRNARVHNVCMFGWAIAIMKRNAHGACERMEPSRGAHGAAGSRVVVQQTQGERWIDAFLAIVSIRI